MSIDDSLATGAGAFEGWLRPNDIFPITSPALATDRKGDCPPLGVMARAAGCQGMCDFVQNSFANLLRWVGRHKVPRERDDPPTVVAKAESHLGIIEVERPGRQQAMLLHHRLGKIAGVCKLHVRVVVSR